MEERNKRILVSRGMAAGDSLMGSAVLKPLREKYPNAEIHYMTNFPEMFCDPPEDYPYAELMKNPKYPIEEYDIYHDFGAIMQEMPMPYRASFIHYCCAKAGVRFNNPEIIGDPIKTGFHVGIVPKTGRSHDTWDPEKFQELTTRLRKLGIRSISFGPMDSPRFENCFNSYPKWNTSEESGDRHDWAYAAPKMCKDVHRTARIMMDLDVVVSGDTGLTHVAAAVGVPVVLLLTHGSQETDFWLNSKHSRIARSKTTTVSDLDVNLVFDNVCKILFEKGSLNYANG